MFVLTERPTLCKMRKGCATQDGFRRDLHSGCDLGGWDLNRTHESRRVRHAPPVDELTDGQDTAKGRAKSAPLLFFTARGSSEVEAEGELDVALATAYATTLGQDFAKCR